MAIVPFVGIYKEVGGSSELVLHDSVVEQDLVTTNAFELVTCAVMSRHHLDHNPILLKFYKDLPTSPCLFSFSGNVDGS